jgi:hypothetical protein
VSKEEGTKEKERLQKEKDVSIFMTGAVVHSSQSV